MENKIFNTTRRGLFEFLAGGAGLAALGFPESALAQSRKDVLVVGLDISDSITYDPAVASGPTAPVVFTLVYNTLVTTRDGDYVTVKPAIATAWERTPNGRGWRFTLREGMKFGSGNPLTAADVKWSFDRMLNVHGQPVEYFQNLASVEVVDDTHIDLLVKHPERSIVETLAVPCYVVYDSKLMEANGGDASPDAKAKDKAKEWLNQHSAGTGPYILTGWQRNISVQFERNPNYWGPVPRFPRILIRHMAEPATQLLAVQRGDIDVAFNLIPEQIATLKDAKDLRVEQLESFDMVYFGLTANPAFNKALAVREARQAIAWAIDYDGIINHVMGGARRPASVLPLGTLGSTPEIAKQIGYHEDLAKSKECLAKAGFPDGFSFKLSFGNALVDGVSYSVLAQKVQSDLARVGIKAELDQQDYVTLRTMYYAGNATSMITAWGADGVISWVWASAAVERLAKRMHYKVPPELAELVDQATDEPDPKKKEQLWIKFQKRVAEEAYLLILLQRNYRVVVNNRLKTFPLNAAARFADIDEVTT